MGGSFNPAHEGHRYISMEAIKRCRLNKVIWFVTPQNPLKTNQAQNHNDRINLAKKVSASRDIIVSPFEQIFTKHYTIELVKRLKQMYPNIDFYYIMGADNATTFHKWKSWKEIITTLPLIIFDRGNFHKNFSSSKLCQNFRGVICNSLSSKTWPTSFWHFIKIRKNPQSSTKIRYDQNIKQRQSTDL